MSSQRGNAVRTRPQKYQNKTKFKNNLHDTSQNIKLINSLEIDNVCTRCKDIIEWKIKYKKYKPLKAAATCVKCHNKTVLHAYHTVCMNCAKTAACCAKCARKKELVESASTSSIEKLLKSPGVEEAIKSLSERRRRTFYRQINSPTCGLNTEDLILNKIKELSMNGGKSLHDFDDDFFHDSDEGKEEEEDDDGDDGNDYLKK